MVSLGAYSEVLVTVKRWLAQILASSFCRIVPFDASFIGPITLLLEGPGSAPVAAKRRILLLEVQRLTFFGERCHPCKRIYGGLGLSPRPRRLFLCTGSCQKTYLVLSFPW